MSAPQTTSEFVSLLERSQLLSPRLIPKLRAQAAEMKIESAQQLAKTLCRSKVLTHYQAGRLLNGDTENFYLAKFKILDVLGRGGMGTVYLAEQITMHRLVAIKVMKNVGSGQRRKDYFARFTREARAVAALNHPNIIRAFDFDEINGLPYIVMEYVEGLNTEQQVLTEGPLGWAQAADYIRQAALGLEHAFQAQLVHRDIKPGNLLVDRDGCVKVLDLGLVSDFHSASNSDSLTTDAEHLGTVDYIAPEQALDSHTVDIRADIYSLGATFYFLVTGSPMFTEMSTSQKLLAQQVKQPQPLQELIPGIPDGLAAIIQRMIAKNPEDRPQTPQAVVDLLREFSESKSPPFDFSALAHGQEQMKAYLRKSPHPSTISCIATPSSSSQTTIESGSGVRRQSRTPAVTQAGQSRSKTSNNDVEQVEDYGDPAAETSAQLPRRRSTGNRAGKRHSQPAGKTTQKKRRTAKARPGRGRKWLYVTGGAVVAIAVAVFVLFTYSNANTSNDVAQKSSGTPVTPNRTSAAETSVQPAESVAVELTPQERQQRFRNLRTRLRRDPSVALLLAFEDYPDDNNQLISNAHASAIGRVKVDVVGEPKFVKGRWGGQHAVKLNGKTSRQRLELNETASKWFNFSSSYTISVWFKADELQSQFETLVSKGDLGWRLQRKSNENVLEFATNPFRPNDEHLPPARQARVFSTTPVDDGFWHMATGMVDVNDGRLTLKMYLDGRLEDSKTLYIKHLDTEATVMIGGNSDFPGWVNGVAPPDKRGSRYFTGLLDEVVIFQRTLSDDEVRDMYECGRVDWRK